MQQFSKQSLVISKVESPVKSPILSYVVFTISVALTLIAIFALSAWTELGGWQHAAQHVLIFGSGASAGASLLSILKAKKEQ